MLSGQKILITGVTGMVATPLALHLARDNEVWGVARFTDPAARRPYEEAGITTRAVDLGGGDLSALPADFTHVLHLGWQRADLAELQQALRTNVEGAGLLLQHCRKAKATLVMSSMGVYSPQPDPWHKYVESDPIGRGATAYAPTSPACKLGLEAVARFCARAFAMPIVIARLNTFMGPQQSFPGMVIRSVLDDTPIFAPHDPNPHSPIHMDDMAWQVEALLDAAATPALTVNWCGDDTVPLQDWARMAGRVLGKDVRLGTRAVAGAPPGTAADPTLRASLTGPCRTRFDEAFRALCATFNPAAEEARGARWGALGKG
jgi:nucleoside-diphosphate-sugar epimerase